MTDGTGEPDDRRVRRLRGTQRRPDVPDVLHIAELRQRLALRAHRFVVTGHDLRIGQIIANLIENARSFVPEKGGKITVRLVRTRSRCVTTIEDNGPGIQAENIDRIFERFYTDRPESEGFGQNSGLGLSISRQIAEAHGGSLRAENITDAEGGQVLGARFILALPVDAAA